MKKLISLALTLIMCCSFTSLASSFYDVPEDHWARSHIDAMFNAGIINGDTDGSFRPEDNVTRGELCKMMLLASGKTVVDFSSADGNHWATPYAEALKSHVWTYEEWHLNSAQFDVFVNRSEVALLLMELHRGSPISLNHMMDEVNSTLSSKFKDAENIGGYTESVYYVVTNNLMNGYEDGYFHPEWKITRAELCTVLNRAFGTGINIGNSTSTNTNPVVTNPTAFDILSQDIISKSSFISEGKFFLAIPPYEGTTISFVYQPADDTIILMANIDSSKGETLIGLELTRKNDHTVVLSTDGEIILGGTHKNSKLIVELCPYLSLKAQGTKVVEASYKVFDSTFKLYGIDVQLSDFGIFY